MFLFLWPEEADDYLAIVSSSWVRGFANVVLSSDDLNQCRRASDCNTGNQRKSRFLGEVPYIRVVLPFNLSTALTHVQIPKLHRGLRT